MNHEVTTKQKLLDNKGNLNEPGYSKKEVFEYDRKQIKVAKWKIKEWDYYFIGNKNYGLCLTFGDNGYVGSLSFTHLDFNAKTEIDAPDIVGLPLGKFKLPNTSSIGNAEYKTKLTEIHFDNDGVTRHLYGKRINFSKSDIEGMVSTGVKFIINSDAHSRLAVGKNHRAFCFLPAQ